MTNRLGALELAGQVLDSGSFIRWDEAPYDLGPLDSAYAAALAAARDKTGLDEAVITGEGRIRGRRVAVVVGEFGFLAGSIGVVAAERLVRAIERATAERLPLVASPTSGGTRMQEGTVAFVQMVKISAAVAAHKAAGLPYLVYLRSPTTGGVFASWGSLGHVTAAEPGAMIGFLGPRVYEALYGEPFPEGVQTAENLYANGLLDAVVPPERVRDIAANVLDVLIGPHAGLPTVPEVAQESLPDVPAWESIERSRRPDRPGVRTLLRDAAHKVTTLEGTGAGELETGLLCALAKFGAAPCILLGQDREFSDRPLGPAALREARRGFRLAAELGLPLVTLPAPTVCVLLGQGAGGGALALLPADRVLCAQHGWLSPLPPEGASAILYRTVDKAPEIAAAQGVRSLDLLRNGVVDRIIAEHPDAAEEPTQFARRLGQVLEHELAGLLGRDPQERIAARLQRFRRLGTT